MVFLPRNDERLPHARDHFASLLWLTTEELSVQAFARAMGATAISCRGVVDSLANARGLSRRLGSVTGLRRLRPSLWRRRSTAPLTAFGGVLLPVAAPIVGTRIGGPNFNCVRKSLTLLFLHQETFEVAAAPERERLPAAGPRRCRRVCVPVHARGQESKSWRGTCNHARNTALLRCAPSTKGGPHNACKNLFTRPKRD